MRWFPKAKTEFAQILQGEPLEVALKSDDYAVPRGLSHAVYKAMYDGIYGHQDVQGVIMTSARSFYTPKSGDNIALFDDPALTSTATRLSLYLKIMRELEVVGTTKDGKTRLSVKNL